MDSIQKVLIKVGRKDLAQKYFKKVSSLMSSTPSKPANVVYYSTDNSVNVQVPYILSGEQFKTKLTFEIMDEIQNDDKLKAKSIREKVSEVSDEVHKMTFNLEQEILQKVKKLVKELDEIADDYKKGGISKVLIY